VPEAPTSLAGYVMAVVGTMLAARDKADQRNAAFAYTVHIPTGNFAATDFDLTKADQVFLFESGQQAMSDYLASQDGNAVGRNPVVKGVELSRAEANIAALFDQIPAFSGADGLSTDAVRKLSEADTVLVSYAKIN